MPFCQPVLLEFPVFSIETYRKKETAVILKRTDQLPQNLARIHNLVGSLIEVIKIFNFSILPIASIVLYCSHIVRLLFHI